MSCNTRYWHSISNSQPDKPSNPALQKENNAKLAALMAAREAQDAKWSFAQTHNQVGTVLFAQGQTSNQNSIQNQRQNPT